MLAFYARPKRYEWRLGELACRSYAPQCRVAAARHRYDAVLEQCDVVEPAVRWHEPIHGGVDAPFAHRALDLVRPRPRAESHFNPRRDTGEPLAKAHRNHRP